MKGHDKPCRGSQGGTRAGISQEAEGEGKSGQKSSLWFYQKEQARQGKQV